MTNEELVNNIVCKNCRARPCDVFNKEYCFIYDSALQVANEKDKQYQKVFESYIQHFDNN